ncbi:MAG: efflux RND transporter periplasmic adaptor subunit [Sinimarinibacterium flocculans]|uniref:efflux RND transporter periplasmic adaptor subunit n=1 Tax=Sinimarinibacterium flocculans TaxID=985250 RepID=UPI003C4FF23F
MSTPDPIDILPPPRSAWRRRAPLLAALAVLAAAAFWWWQPDRSAAAPAYVTAEAERGAIVARVTATGTLSALVTVDVGSQVSGRIQALYADYNAQVTEGQVIAKIDPTLFETQVASARANVRAAEAGVLRATVQATDAQRQAQRAGELFERKLIAQSERDTVRATAQAASADVAAAEGQLAQARAALAQAEANLHYTDIVSPTDGIVISRSVNVGQTVAASLQAPVLFQIAQDLRQMQVNTNVAEADVGRLGADMPVYFTVDAWPGERFAGHVRQIRHAPQVLQNVVTYDAVIDVDNADLRLKPGMTANVTFVVAERDDVLRIPNAALRFRPPATLQAPADDRDPRRVSTSARPAVDETAGTTTVWVLDDGQPRPRRIRTGITDGSYTEVLDGALQPGERVLTGVGGAGSGAATRRDGPPRMRML